MTALLELTAISRRFGAVQALHDADFILAAGQVHALLGENGAGKSTLMRIANGMIRPDSGSYRLEGRDVRPATPREARASGVGMVHQHFSAVPAFSVRDNIALAAGWTPGRHSLDGQISALMERVGLHLEPGAVTDTLTVSQRQALEILMALAGNARILLLDEPTASLAAEDAERVLQVVRRFTGQGGGAVLITHKLEEALRYADQITVLRRGKVTRSGPATEQNAAILAEAMLGEAPPIRARVRPGPPGDTVARAAGLVVPASAGGSGLHGATIAIRSGEMVGIAAVGGNGERELLRALAGLLRPVSGIIEVQGPGTLIPEDRTTEALIPAFTLTENRTLATQLDTGLIDWEAERHATLHLIEQSGVRASGPDAPAAELSGGNQQRFVIARQLEAKPAFIVAENPSRGLDIKATEEVFARLRAASDGGAGVLFHSVDLDEVLAMSDRVVVVNRGRVITPPPDADRTTIGRLMLTGTADPTG